MFFYADKYRDHTRRAKDILFITAVVLAVLNQILFVFLTGCLRVC
ncbi:hypothetical protein P9D34_14675 [Bacillus swezeyi]|nr:hypothetical protein [Bacillus swezeyi]MEC1261677.1 hypothetical protein [Bacillus swezeyi]MED2926460.1 hypothetical protein [Bacillus swezeyi]MED2943930.1 hypothetical protein [Bacillus swezeyi]MED2965977.1 hypothetical protein [Bacillus swezeyi]MED2978601.1 hypothetical protein [Bacillus swezeyi]